LKEKSEEEEEEEDSLRLFCSGKIVLLTLRPPLCWCCWQLIRISWQIIKNPLHHLHSCAFVLPREGVDWIGLDWI